MFDCSRVLEYAKIWTVLQSSGYIRQLISLTHVLTGIKCIVIYLAPVVQKVDNTIHRINL